MLTPIPHVILAFISIDRFLKIVHPRKFLLRNKTSFKYCFCLAATMFNIFYYIPDLLFYGLDTVQNDIIVDSLSAYANKSSMFETKISCKRKITFLNYLNFLNDFIIPLGITKIFTILLIKSIYESRKRARSSIIIHRPNQIDQNQKIFDSQLHQLLNELLNQDEFLILIIKLNYLMNIFYVLNCNKI